MTVLFINTIYLRQAKSRGHNHHKVLFLQGIKCAAFPLGPRELTTFTFAYRALSVLPCAAAAKDATPFAGHGWHRTVLGGMFCRSNGLNNVGSPRS